jgi:hypothetical protein
LCPFSKNNILPRLNSKFHKRSFQYSAIKIWNDFPLTFSVCMTVPFVDFHVRISWPELGRSGTYPCSFVTQIFHSGQPCHGGDRKTFEVITSTWPRGTLGSVASLLAATLYQGNPDMKINKGNRHANRQHFFEFLC